MIKFGAKILLLSVLTLACERAKNLPPEPYVELREYELRKESISGIEQEFLWLKVYFYDGDGNIGLEPSDTLAPNHCAACPHYHNLFINFYSKVNGVFETPFPYNSRFESLTPDAQNKLVEGYIEYKIDVFNRLSDTVMVELYVEDRDLNKSNTIQTPEVFVSF